MWFGLALDPSDLELGEVMAEADRLVETFTALELEGDAFFTAVLLDDLGSDASALNSWSTNLGVVTIVHEENLAELDFFVRSDGKLIDTDGVTFLNAVLLTASFENCVGHGLVSAKIGRRKRASQNRSGLRGAGIHHRDPKRARFF